MSTHISIERPPIITTAIDETEDVLFSKRLQVYEFKDSKNGQPVFIRDELESSAGENLLRIWNEKGDFSSLSTERLLFEQQQQQQQQRNLQEGKGVEGEEEEEEQAGDPVGVGQDGITPGQMRQLQTDLIKFLDQARSELTTALDLLSVLALPTDPPTVDLESLPLPQETLTIVPSVPNHLTTLSNEQPLLKGQDDLLPIAISLKSLEKSSRAFFKASERISNPSSSSSSSSLSRRTTTLNSEPNWKTILSLHENSIHKLLPLGAQKGASFSGHGEIKIAREIAVFFGFVESHSFWRRNSIVRLNEIENRFEKGKRRDRSRGGRNLVVEVEFKGSKSQSCVWCGAEVGRDDEEKELNVEEVLKQRSRSIFAEELFSVLSNEARTDAAVKARLEIGKRSEGDSIITEGHGWTLTVTMVSSPSPKIEAALNESNSSSGSLASVILPLLRLLFLKEFSRRRIPNQTWSQPLLQTLSSFLSHQYRLSSIEKILSSITSSLTESGIYPISISYYPSSSTKTSILKILSGEKELGGRIVLRIGPRSNFHISHSTLLPLPPNPLNNNLQISHQSLVLQAPKSAPVVVNSVGQLKIFINEQIGRVVEDFSRGDNKRGEKKDEKIEDVEMK